MAKELNRQGVSTTHTGYVSTRWYRAPEIILRAGQYDGKIDVFALGCIMAELYTNDPLLPGNSESDMIYRLSSLIGHPPSNLFQN